MRLREIRRAKGLTMKQVAAAAKSSEAAISLYERNIRKPNLLTAKRIADALGCKLDELIGDEANDTERT